MRKSNHAMCRLGLESLEGRLMLAGNVIVRVVDGNLFIFGDRLDNSIEIHAAELPGSYVVAGLPTGDSTRPVAATLINGSTEPLIVKPISGDVRIDLREGNDSVHMGSRPELDILERPLNFPRNLSIGNVAGDDRVTLNAAHIGADLRIAASGGTNQITALGTSVGGSARISTGVGADTVALNGVKVGGDLNITTSAGNDRIELRGADVGGRVFVDTALGNDQIAVEAQVRGDLLINAGGQLRTTAADLAIAQFADADSVELLATTVGGSARVSTSFCGDKVTIDRLDVRGVLAVDTGEGSDEVNVGTLPVVATDPSIVPPQLPPALSAAIAAINTGSGADTVNLFRAAVDRLLAVDLGAGDDTLNAVDNVVAGTASLNGGAGIDTLHDYHNRFARLRVIGFEKIDPPTDTDDSGGGSTVQNPPRRGQITIL